MLLLQCWISFLILLLSWLVKNKLITLFNKNIFLGPVTVIYLSTEGRQGSLPAWVVTLSYIIWLFVTRLLKYIPHFTHRPQDILYIPAWIIFSIYFALMKIYCLFTLHITEWGTRKNVDDQGLKDYKIEDDMDIYENKFKVIDSSFEERKKKAKPMMMEKREYHYDKEYEAWKRNNKNRNDSDTKPLLSSSLSSLEEEGRRESIDTPISPNIEKALIRMTSCSSLGQIRRDLARENLLSNALHSSSESTIGSSIRHTKPYDIYADTLMLPSRAMLANSSTQNKSLPNNNNIFDSIIEQEVKMFKRVASVKSKRSSLNPGPTLLLKPKSKTPRKNNRTSQQLLYNHAKTQITSQPLLLLPSTHTRKPKSILTKNPPPNLLFPTAGVRFNLGRNSVRMSKLRDRELERREYKEEKKRKNEVVTKDLREK